MTIDNVMKRDVASCAVSDSCLQAARIMRDRRVGFVVVTELRGSKVLGVVTDRDICMASLAKNQPLSEIPVVTAMSKSVHSCREGSDLATAHSAMREHRVRRLPVLDAGGGLVGVVSLSDLARQASERAMAASTPDVALTLSQVSTPFAASQWLRGGI